MCSFCLCSICQGQKIAGRGALTGKLKCETCGKVCDEQPRDGLRCKRCGSDIPTPPSAEEFFQRPDRKKNRKRAAKKISEPRKRVPEKKLKEKDKVPPPIKRQFDYERFFQKFAQLAVVAGISSFIMLVIFMSIDRKRDGRKSDRETVVQSQTTPPGIRQQSIDPDAKQGRAGKVPGQKKASEESSTESQTTEKSSSAPSGENGGGGGGSTSGKAGANDTAQSAGRVDSQDSSSATNQLKNHPPEIFDQKFRVFIDASEGEEIGTLQATDPDGDTLQFSIVNPSKLDSDQDNRSLVKLNGPKLLLDDIDEFGGRKQSPITFKAKVSDGQLSDIANVWVNVQTQNNLAINDLADEAKLEKAVGLIQCSVDLTQTNGTKVHSPILYRVYAESEIPRYLYKLLGYEPSSKQIEEFKKNRCQPYKGDYAVLTASHGTCFVISADGYAITNRHVIEDHVVVNNQTYNQDFARNSSKYSKVEPKLIVYFRDKKPYEAEVIPSSIDGKIDFALIKIKGLQSNPYFQLFSGSDVPRNTTVTALGYPGNDRTPTDQVIVPREEFWPIESDRIINSQSGETTKPPYKPAENAAYRLLQHSAAVFGGNSGGPLITKNGLVVGINTLTQEEEAVNFAILMQSCMDAIERHQQIDADWIDAVQ